MKNQNNMDIALQAAVTTCTRAPGAEVISLEEVRRRARVLDLKRRIKSGVYKPDLGRLAARMIQHPDFHIES